MNSNYGSIRCFASVILRLKCDGTCAETRFRLSVKRTSPFKSAGASVQSTTGNRGVRISGSNAGYTMFRGSVQSTGYPLHSPVSPSLLLPCVTVCHHISTGLYRIVTLMILSPLLDRFSLKMEALRSIETSITVYLSARCHIPEDLNLLGFHCCVFVTQHFFLKSENLHGGNHDGRLAHCHRDVREDRILR